MCELMMVFDMYEYVSFIYMHFLFVCGMVCEIYICVYGLSIYAFLHDYIYVFRRTCVLICIGYVCVRICVCRYV
jgi:hypothetical protein